MAAQIICAAIIVVAAVYMFWDRHHRMKTTGQARAGVDEFMNTLSEEDLNASRQSFRKKKDDAEKNAQTVAKSEAKTDAETGETVDAQETE